MKSLYISLYLFSIFLLIFLLSPRIIYAQNNIVEDFNDGNTVDSMPFNWIQNGNWIAVDGVFKGTSFSNNQYALTYIEKGTVWKDYIFNIDIKGISGPDRHVLFRYDNSFGNNGYALKYRESNYGFNNIELQKIGVKVLTSKNFFSSLGNTINFKVKLVGEKIDVYKEGDSEPILSYVDNENPILSGTIAFFVESPGIPNTINTTEYDNLSIINLDNNLLVDNLKQFDPLWKDNVYDHIDNNINNVGCALTSAAMILRYHNYNVYPDDLNTWFINNHGYNRVGDVVWNAVSQYAKQNKNNSIDPNAALKNLEWKRVKNNIYENIKNEINLSQPSISHVPGHFLVNKGYDENEIFVNDPASNTFSLLSQTENFRKGTVDRIETFTPSDTDLSYLYLVYDDDAHLEVFDPWNNEIDQEYFTKETSIINDSINTTEPINTFTFPKPSPGEYKINIFKNGLYKLDFYLYNDEAELVFKSIEGISFDSFKVNYSENLGEFELVKNIDINSLINDLDEMFSSELISNQGIYTDIKTHLLFAKKLYDQQKFDKYLLVLISISNKLTHLEKFINENAYWIFMSDLEYLIENNN